VVIISLTFAYEPHRPLQSTHPCTLPLMHSHDPTSLLSPGLPPAHLLRPDLRCSRDSGGPGVLHSVCAGEVQPRGPTGESGGEGGEGRKRERRGGKGLFFVASCLLILSVKLAPPSPPPLLPALPQTVIVTLLLAMCALQFTYNFPPAGYLNVIQQVGRRAGGGGAILQSVWRQRGLLDSGEGGVEG
jgi:hypothetical protein